MKASQLHLRLGPHRVSVCATEPTTGHWTSSGAPETFFMPVPSTLELSVTGVVLAERVSIVSLEVRFPAL